MKLHPRTLPVQHAENELRGRLLDWQIEHDLTDVEVIRALLGLGHEWSKYLLRAERHPGDPDTKADEAGDDDPDEAVPTETPRS